MSTFTTIQPMVSVPLEGARVGRAEAVDSCCAWQLLAASGGASTYVFAAEDEADAERWVGACRQQALVSASELDLTPRLVRELEVNGFLEPAHRALIINPTELELGRQLATGFYGAVYMGTWRGARVVCDGPRSRRPARCLGR